MIRSLTMDDLKEMVTRFKGLIKERTGKANFRRIPGSNCGARSAPCLVPG